jgi:hypothetical protein
MEATTETMKAKPGPMKWNAKKSEVKNFEKADEVRNFPYGKLELVTVAGKTIGRATLNPGWRWSTSIKEAAQTVSCESSHFQYHISGVLKVKMDDGEELELRPGDISMLAPGHDAWVVGEEPVVVVDFQGMVDYARKH